MYYFTCKFTSGRDKFSNVAKTCLIKSDINLKEDVSTTELKDYYEIEEILDDYDCENIYLDEISKEEYNERKNKMDKLCINSKDLH